jgi:HEAT repeat protein
MTIENVVRIVVEIEGLAVALMVGVLVVAGLRASAAEARRAVVREAVRRLLGAALSGRPHRRDDVGVVRSAARSDVIASIVSVAQSLTSATGAVRQIATLGGILQYANKRSHSKRWWRRLEGARLLTLLGAREDDARRMLRDPHPLVRAQGAAVAATYPFPEASLALGALLHDDAAVCRFAATQAIMQLGPEALEGILDELRRGDLRLPNADVLIELAASMPSPAMFDIALRYSQAPDPAVRRAATALLAAVGGEPTVERLMLLLADDAPTVRSAAAQALGAIGEWRAASALGERLADDNHDVRFAAAFALHRLGAPGQIVLRRIISRGPQRAAATARESADLVTRVSA